MNDEEKEKIEKKNTRAIYQIDKYVILIPHPGLKIINERSEANERLRTMGKFFNFNDVNFCKKIKFNIERRAKKKFQTQQQ